jgi:hypothetical protein
LFGGKFREIEIIRKILAYCENENTGCRFNPSYKQTQIYTSKEKRKLDSYWMIHFLVQCSDWWIPDWAGGSVCRSFGNSQKCSWQHLQG